MPWTDPTHPCWSLARLAIQVLGAGLILWLTATSFDATELKALGGMAGIGLLAEKFIRPKGDA